METKLFYSKYAKFWSIGKEIKHEEEQDGLFYAKFFM